MTCGLDIELWVGWMEIKGHFVSQDVVFFLLPWVIRYITFGETLACQIVKAGVCSGSKEIWAWVFVYQVL
jgi:hypothetical protein